jgi:POT family proton-dependent oligopeptide transporter
MSVMAEASAPATVRSDEAVFFGQPRGLAYIVFTEAWERFSFYGMQALLVLYMTGHLLHPGTVENVIGFAGFRAVVEAVFGQLSPQALATQIFGLYIGLIYFVPVLGGLLGDRVLGRRKAVLAGAVLMAGGHFLMAFESAFLFALALLILGSGLLKGNLAAQVGGLYAKDDTRRDTAFSLYCMSINVGAFLAPLVCGTLGELYGWHYGFGAAGVGMLIGIAIYVHGREYLPVDHIAGRGERVKLQRGDGRIIAALLTVLAITALYWTAQTQVWNTYPLWIRDRVDRELLGFEIPVTWFQSLDSLAVLVFAPAVIWFWRWQSERRTEPGDLVKIALGCGFFALACVLLAIGEWVAGADKTQLIWPALFHFVCATAYLYAGPIALSLASRAAPVAVNAMMVGAYYLALFAGGIVSGWLGRFYEMLSPAEFWLMHAAIVGAGSVLLVLLRRPLLREMKLERAPA